MRGEVSKPPSPSPDPWIRLYVPSGRELPRVEPSPLARSWYTKGMYHCLPLTMAGQLGWTVLNPSAIAAVWDGSESADGLKVGLSKDDFHATSHFGHGILTINPGFYVRTSPEVDILVKGVPNHVKDGVSPLEGLVETDWFDGSFTVNVRLTRPGLIVTWDVDEPLFQLVPYPRGWIEQFRTEVMTDGAEHAAFFETANAWERDRVELVERERTIGHQGWDGKYRRGVRRDGEQAPPSHNKKLHVPPFLELGSNAPTGQQTMAPDGASSSTK